ncbi:MAG: TetR/AcrR family transcriptional regulator [Deltaproteobacteria bacterium]|nr:TetR/AcrR family transcriptional regulator [Deltaproteobacteria bacterium]
MSPREAPSTKDKHEAILTAAFSLFGHYGYRRTSIDDIAQEAGIAKGTVYLYFKSKEEIFRALAQQLIDKMLAASETAQAAAHNVPEQLRGILDAKFGYFFELLHASAHVREILDAKNQLCTDLFAQADRRYQRLLAQTIAEAEKRGELHVARIGLEPEAAAELLTRSASGLGTYSTTAPTLPAFRRHLDALVRVFVVGLGGQIPS